ncbi:MAG: LytR/AlgR family response regulator transcription factor [Lachnospiraceae bacterium]
MEQLRIGVYEDNARERLGLVEMITKSGSPVTLVSGESGEELLAAFRPGRFDLLFLDIYMTGMTGMEALEQIRQTDPNVDVCIVTSSREFALESYRMRAVRYLEKPAVKEDVEELLREELRKKESLPHLMLRQKGELVRIPYDQIAMVEQHGRNVRVVLAGGGVISGPGNLTKIEETLAFPGFCRCHKSYLVNLLYVTGIDRELMAFALQGGELAYIARRRFWAAKRAYEEALFGIAAGSNGTAS